MTSTLRCWVWVAGVVLALAIAAPGRAAGDAQRGKQIGYTCLGCHGIENYKNVYPTYNVPKLVGQHPEYIVAALKGYRGKERSHGTMYAQASSLSDQDMQDLAAYLSQQPLAAGAAVVRHRAGQGDGPVRGLPRRERHRHDGRLPDTRRPAR